MDLRKIKKSFNCLIGTPFHPQWLLARNTHNSFMSIAAEIDNDVIDIGCGDKSIKKYLNNNVRYYGLDYYQTARYWYDCLPDIYGDAQSLPLNDASASNILMLDVLEHIPDPQLCINEISRILKPGGKLIIQVPFVYPLHDAPLDFHRWTEFGFNELFKNTDLAIISIDSTGKPIETAGVILNIALCKILINAINHKKPVVLLWLAIPFLVPVINIICFALSCLTTEDRIMPLNYQVTVIKQST